jgi:hypothetical protein
MRNKGTAESEHAQGKFEALVVFTDLSLTGYL